MPRPRRKKSRAHASLIPRFVSDDNFIHVVRMFPLMRMWAAGLESGMVVDFNARNMAQMPVEIAEAFIRAHAADRTALGYACRDVAAAIDDDGISGLARLYSAKGVEANG